MATEESDLEPYVTVGRPVVFHSDPFVKEAPRYPTVIRGWRKPSYLLLDRPKIAGRYAAIRENQPCVIRFVHEGKACAFDSLVLDWDTRQYNAYCRVEWPRSVKVVAFRKYERARVHIPCTLKVGDDAHAAEISDLSVGGCRLQTMTPVEIGAEASLEFTLPDGTQIESLTCVVRNAQCPGDQVYLGCEFHEGQVCVESHVAFFIATTLERSGVCQAHDREILLIDDDPVHAAELRRVFQIKGYNALISTGMLDGLVRLRTSVPEAVVVNDNQQELSGLMAARLINMTQGLESVPVFIYDTRGEGQEKQTVEVTAREYFRSGTPLFDIVNRVIAHISTNGNRHE